MKFLPLHDRVLIKRLEPEKKTSGGVLLPDSAKEKPVKGEVVAVGKGRMGDNGQVTPLLVQVGDIVFFAKWGGTEITVEGEEYLVMKENDIIGIGA